MQGDDEQAHGEDAKRDIDKENPVPREVRDDDAAEHRPDEARHGPHRTEEALHPPALLDVENVTDDRDRDGLHRASAEALDRPEDDELPHRGRHAARDRAEEEEGDAEEE